MIDRLTHGGVPPLALLATGSLVFAGVPRLSVRGMTNSTGCPAIVVGDREEVREVTRPSANEARSPRRCLSIF